MTLIPVRQYRLPHHLKRQGGVKMKNQVRRNQSHIRRRGVGKWLVVTAFLATVAAFVKRRIGD
jgi:hypothetical protein